MIYGYVNKPHRRVIPRRGDCPDCKDGQARCADLTVGQGRAEPEGWRIRPCSLGGAEFGLAGACLLQPRLGVAQRVLVTAGAGQPTG